MNTAYSTNKDIPEFFWPHSDESRYVINMTWKLLLKALDNEDKVARNVSFKTTEARKLHWGMERGRVQAYLNVLARFDGNFCGEQDKILIEARRALADRR